jgi:hypothetical protein
MKRAIVIIMLVVLLSVSMCGCNEAEAGNRRLWILDSGTMGEIYVDNLTGVQYLRTYRGGVCVMVDAAGKPLIWEGYYDKNSSR